jgi:hypothetical protein
MTGVYSDIIYVTSYGRKTYTCQTTCFVTGSMFLYRITPQSGIDHDLVSVVKILLKAFFYLSSPTPSATRASTHTIT